MDFWMTKKSSHDNEMDHMTAMTMMTWMNGSMNCNQNINKVNYISSDLHYITLYMS